MVVSRSSKILQIVDSSAEAEVNAVHRYVQQILWVEPSFEEMTIGLNPRLTDKVAVFQDNMSALVLEHNGAKPCSKSAPINRKFFKIRE